MGEGRLAQNLEDRFKRAKNAMRCSSTAESGPFSLRIANHSNTEVTDGKSTLLLVEASCRQLVSYEWKKDDEPLVNDSTYSGVKEDLLVIKFASQGIEGEYTCHVSNQGKKVCSNKITLTLCYPPSKKRLLSLYNVQREVLSDSSPLMVTYNFIDLNLKKSSTEDIKDYIYGDKDKPEFRDYNSGELVLITGCPGSGKTTLVHKITKDWAKGSMLFNARLVFIIAVNSVPEEETV